MIYPINRARHAIASEGQDLDSTPAADLWDTIHEDVDQWARDNGYRAEMGQVMEDGVPVYCDDEFALQCEDIARSALRRLMAGGAA